MYVYTCGCVCLYSCVLCVCACMFRACVLVSVCGLCVCVCTCVWVCECIRESVCKEGWIIHIHNSCVQSAHVVELWT